MNKKDKFNLKKKYTKNFSKFRKKFKKKTSKKSSEKVVLFLGGGSMTGVFGAGIVSKLQEENLYDKIETIYASSAGVFSMAYFLSKQTQHLSGFYCNALINGFIKPWKAFTGLFHRMWNSYIFALPPQRVHNPININMLVEEAKSRKILDINTLKENPIKGYAKLFDTKTKKLKYVNIKKNTFRVLERAVSVVPYYFTLDNQVDGGIFETLGFNELRKRHPKSKIIICLNHPPYEKFKDFLRYLADGFVSFLIYKDRKFFTLMKRKEKDLKKDIFLLNLEKRKKRVLLVYPLRNHGCGNTTTNPRNLKKFYLQGKKQANKIVKFINKF